MWGFKLRVDLIRFTSWNETRFVDLYKFFFHFFFFLNKMNVRSILNKSYMDVKKALVNDP